MRRPVQRFYRRIKSCQNDVVFACQMKQVRVGPLAMATQCINGQLIEANSASVGITGIVEFLLRDLPASRRDQWKIPPPFRQGPEILRQMTQQFLSLLLRQRLDGGLDFFKRMHRIIVSMRETM